MINLVKITQQQQQTLLTKECLNFLQILHNLFNNKRLELLTARKDLKLDFDEKTRFIREDLNWRVFFNDNNYYFITYCNNTIINTYIPINTNINTNSNTNTPQTTSIQAAKPSNGLIDRR